MGGLSTPKGGKTTTTTDVKSVPPYVQAAQENLLSQGQSVLGPHIQAGAYTQAPLNADTIASYDLTRNLAGQAFQSQPTAPMFDTAAYLAQNPDVAAAAQANGYDPAQFAQYHYGAYGASEGRAQPMTAEIAAKNPIPQLSTQKLGDISAPSLIDYRDSTDWKAKDAAATYDPSTYTSKGYTASTYDPSTYNATQYGASTYDPTQYGASRYDASTVAGKDIQALLNPFTQSVVDTTAANMRRQLNASQADNAAKAAASGYQGGSRQAVGAAMMDRDFATNLASTTAQLMAQGYDKATATALANASATQSAAAGNAQMQQSAAAANAAALNTAGQFNAGATQSAAAANAAALNAMGQFNAGALNTAGQFNAGARNTADQFTSNADNTAEQFNAGSKNTAGQFNAGAQNTRDQFNAGQGSSMLNAANQNALTLYRNAMDARTSDNSMEIARTQAQEALKSGDFNRQQQAIALLNSIGAAQNQTYQNSLDTPLKYLQALGGITPQDYGGTNTKTAPNTAASPLQTLLGLGMTFAGKMI